MKRVLMPGLGRRRRPANVRHSAETNRWGTSKKYVDAARVALGGRIGLDPMSEEIFNAIVGAERYYTEVDDCFSQDWACETMLLNPAGGLVVEAWRRLVAEYLAGVVVRAVWVGFSVEQLNLLASEPQHPDDFSKLTCRKRISFVHHSVADGSCPDRPDRPGHANYVVGLGISKERFALAFGHLGRISHGRLAVDEDRERVHVDRS